MILAESRDSETTKYWASSVEHKLEAGKKRKLTNTTHIKTT